MTFYLSLAVALLGRLAGAQTVNLMHVVVRNGVSGLYMTVLSTLTLKTLLPTYELSHSKHFPALALTRLRQAEENVPEVFVGVANYPMRVRIAGAGLCAALRATDVAEAIEIAGQTFHVL